MQPYTILGSGGAIGTPLAQQLLKNNKPVRLLSRSGKGIDGAECRKVDVFDVKNLAEAVRGSKVVFLLVGLEYNIQIWREQWPKIMENTLQVCGEQGIPLIFFDNVYMYGQVSGKMTEATPFNPNSKKGEVRAHIAHLLLDAVAAKKVTATIARAADFYGPYSDQKSMFYVTVLENLAKGKKAQWLGNPKMPHTMTYTLDAARALEMLADAPESFNQTWHLPSHNPPPVPNDLAKMSAEILGVPFKGVQALPRWMVKIIGWFIPIMREMPEMMYQSEHFYHFDSRKFEQHFNFVPTDYAKGIRDTVAFFNLKK